MSVPPDTRTVQQGACVQQGIRTVIQDMVISQSYDIRADFLHDIHTRRRQTEGILLIFRGNSPLTERKFFICHKNIGRSNLISQPFIQYSGYSPGSVICVQNVVRQIDITAEQQGQLSRITGAGQMPELIIRSGQVPALFPRLYFKNRFLRQAFQILPAVLPGREGRRGESGRPAGGTGS